MQYYPQIGEYAVVNNGEREVNSTFYDGEGRAEKLKLAGGELLGAKRKKRRTEPICFAPSLFSPVKKPAGFLSVEKPAGGLLFYPRGRAARPFFEGGAEIVLVGKPEGERGFLDAGARGEQLDGLLHAQAVVIGHRAAAE